MTVEELRRQLADDYGQERLTMTVGEIEQRAGRASRRRLGGWALATVAAVVVGGFLIWPNGLTGDVQPLATPTPSASPTAAWRATFAEDCERKWQTLDRAKLGPDDRLPPLRMERAQGELGIRVYASERVIADCERTPSGLSVGFTHPADPADELMPDVGAHIQRMGTIAHLDPSQDDIQAADYYVGRVPPGATRVDAVGRDGRVFDAVIEGDLFLVWAPQGGLKHALLRAHRADDMLVDSGPVFNTPDGVDATEQACQELGASFAARAGTPVLPPRRHLIVENDGQVSMYVADGMVAVCVRSEGSLSMVSVSRTTGGAWQPLRYVHQAWETSGWIVGVAPRFATSGTLTLSGGRTVPLVVLDGWFTAGWKGKQPAGQPEKIQIVTPGEVWTEQAGQVTRRPR